MFFLSGHLCMLTWHSYNCSPQTFVPPKVKPHGPSVPCFYQQFTQCFVCNLVLPVLLLVQMYVQTSNLDTLCLLHTKSLNVVNQDLLLCCAAYYNDIVVGAVCCRVDTSENQRRLYIMTLGALAPYRRLGIGTYTAIYGV